MTKFAPFIFLIVFAACHSSTSTTPENAAVIADTAKKAVTYPYAINYSTQFEFADAEKGKTILDIWKDFDNNTLDNSKDKFADTVTLKFPGFTMRASRDSAIASTKSYRASFTAVVSSVDVVMSLRSTDQKADWVAVWGKEIHTSKKNLKDSVEIHELWGFNKDGKIESMEQYTRK